MTQKRELSYEGLLSLEQPLIKVPLEQFKRAIRNSQKYIEREMLHLNAQVLEFSKKKVPSLDDEESRKQQEKALDHLITRLEILKRKLVETKQEEEMFCQRIKKRFIHLDELRQIQFADGEDFERWSKVKLDRLLVDFMLRKGLMETAKLTAEEMGIKDLVDVELFTASKKIEESILNRSCSEALSWCNENKSSLKKLQEKSTLEFNLRIQDFVELIRAKKSSEAIVYAKKYITQFGDLHLKEIQQAMALLCFSPSTNCEVYKKYFDLNRWKKLAKQFQTDNYLLNSLTSESMLKISLQAGLTALKTSNCSRVEDQNVNCPCCSVDSFGKLAEGLPMAHQVNSVIVCRISGEIMNENNPPMVLPNGYVYSQNALNEMAEKNNGNIKCPRSNSTFHISQLRKAFVL
ncbi:GID complex subunit containing RING finger motif [Lobulomyces angularis]|nr:GID complex subunit containing RING finger motif [Lobulomyces angularis]